MVTIENWISLCFVPQSSSTAQKIGQRSSISSSSSRPLPFVLGSYEFESELLLYGMLSSHVSLLGQKYVFVLGQKRHEHCSGKDPHKMKMPKVA